MALFRYAQLRYEELVTNPIKTLMELYSKLGLDLDLSAVKAILKHLDQVPKTLQASVKNNYMSLYR